MKRNGGASDDRRNGFERGGWARGKGDDETKTFIKQTHQRADAFLLGRRTYELFAGSWGTLAERDVPGWEPVVRALNTPRPAAPPASWPAANWSPSTSRTEERGTRR